MQALNLRMRIPDLNVQTMKPNPKNRSKNKIETLKEMVRALGMNPEQVLAKDAMITGATTIQNIEDRQISVLRKQLKELILAEASV